MNLVAVVLICGFAMPIGKCEPATALMMTERRSFPIEWCIDDPNAGLSAAQASATGTYEKIMCDWRADPIDGEELELLEITDADIDAALNRGGPR